MEGFPPRERFERAVSEANERLARHGYAHRGDASDLTAWLRTDTPYPNPSPAEFLDAPFLVVHEVVEIAEVRRMGLRITRDVIVRNMERINDAHLRATEVELDVAIREADAAHVRSRLQDLESWCEDPLLTGPQRAAYEALRDRIRARRHGRREGSGRRTAGGL